MGVRGQKSAESDDSASSSLASRLAFCVHMLVGTERSVYDSALSSLASRPVIRRSSKYTLHHSVHMLVETERLVYKLLNEITLVGIVTGI